MSINASTVSLQNVLLNITISAKTREIYYMRIKVGRVLPLGPNSTVKGLVRIGWELGGLGFKFEPQPFFKN